MLQCSNYIRQQYGKFENFTCTKYNYGQPTLSQGFVLEITLYTNIKYKCRKIKRKFLYFYVLLKLYVNKVINVKSTHI